MTTPKAATMYNAFPSEVYLLKFERTKLDVMRIEYIQVLLAIGCPVTINVLNLVFSFRGFSVTLNFLRHYSGLEVKVAPSWGSALFPIIRRSLVRMKSQAKYQLKIARQ